MSSNQALHDENGHTVSVVEPIQVAELPGVEQTLDEVEDALEAGLAADVAEDVLHDEIEGEPGISADAGAFDEDLIRNFEMGLSADAPEHMFEDVELPLDDEPDLAVEAAGPDVLQAFEAGLAATPEHQELGDFDFGDYEEVVEAEPEAPIADSEAAAEVSEAGHESGEGASVDSMPGLDLGSVMEGLSVSEEMAAASAGIGEQAAEQLKASPAAGLDDPMLSQRFGGAASARELLMNGGMEALNASIRNLKEQAAPLEAVTPGEESLAEVVPETATSQQMLRGLKPTEREELERLRQQQQQQQQSPSYGLMASLAGGLAGLTAGATVGLFKGVSKLALGAADGGTQVYQSYIDKRNTKDFEQRFAELEDMASQMKMDGAELLEGPVEMRRQFFNSERMEETVKRFAAATTALEQSAARKVSQGLKGGAEPSDLMRQTAERIAEFAERHKQLLEGLQSGGSTMLDRFDGITNNLFSMLRDMMVRLARMVVGADAKSAPSHSHQSGPGMR